MFTLSRRLAFAACLALVCPLTARATITPEARAVVERHVAAIGGREVLASIRSTRMKGSIQALGLSGTTEVWTAAPNLRAAVTRIGPFTIQEGFDGSTGWRTDPTTQKPVRLDGKDAEDAAITAYFENDRWLLADQGGGAVSLAVRSSAVPDTYDVLEVAPPAGRPRTFWVHRTTGQIDRAVSRRDQLEIVSEYSEHRPAAGGRTMPHRQVTRILGMPANDLTLVVEGTWVNEPVDAARFRLPAAEDASAGVRWLGAEGRVTLPFRYSARHVWLSASVNGGPPVDFIYDTGASITVIDSAFAARTGLATEGRLQSQGAGATGMASFSRLDTLRVTGPDGRGIELRDAKVAVLSINAFLAPFFWRDCAGILGYDFISRFVNEIDFDRATLTLHDPATFTYAGKGQRVPFELAGTIPVVTMTLDGKYEGVFRIDVGSSSTVDLHAPFVARHGLAKRAPKGIEVTGGGFGGTFQSRLVRMKRLTIGPYGWDRPLVSFSGAKSGAFTSEDYAGNVGTQILERFKVTLDYERRALWLEPGARYREPDRFSRAGVQLARFGDVVKAMQVLPGSPAAKAGLVEGDVVLAVDGTPILDHTPDTLDRVFEGAPGTRVAIEVERDGRRETVRFALRKIL